MYGFFSRRCYVMNWPRTSASFKFLLEILWNGRCTSVIHMYCKWFLCLHNTTSGSIEKVDNFWNTSCCISFLSREFAICKKITGFDLTYYSKRCLHIPLIFTFNASCKRVVKRYVISMKMSFSVARHISVC